MQTTTQTYTRTTPIETVRNDPVFGDYGRLIFPVERSYYSGDTLEQLHLTYYNNIDPDETVDMYSCTDFSSDSHRNTTGSWNLATFSI